MEFSKNVYFDANPKAECSLKLTYNGSLSNSSELWVVYGFDEAWNNTSEVKMEKNESGFEANINILDFKTFNFCFKNANNEWDNNNNCNYISEIEPSYNSELIALFDELFNDELFANITVESEPVAEVTVEKAEEHIAEAEMLNNVETYEDFDIDKLIEEILQPIVSEDSTASFTAEELDSNVISENYIELADETNEKNNIELTEENIDSVTNENVAAFDDSLNMEDVAPEYTNDISSNDDVELSTLVDPLFAISPRKLSKFYLFRKRIRLFVYKLARLPQLIFSEEKE